MVTPEIHKKLQDIIDECQPAGTLINIRCLNRGYMVETGCVSFAFERLGDMIEALNLFLDDPHDAAAAFTEHMSEVVGVDAPPPEPGQVMHGEIGLRDLRRGATRVGYPDQEEPR